MDHRDRIRPSRGGVKAAHDIAGSVTAPTAGKIVAFTDFDVTE
jgi:hypothetical protein